MRSDLQFVSQLKRGSTSAFESIYNKYADKIFNVSKGFHLDQEEAEEIVQEVFLALWECKSLLNENLSLNAFLLTITKNKIINFQKKKINELHRNRDFIRYNSPTCSTENDVILNDLKKFAFQFIDSLPSRNRQIFRLSREEGLKNEEIASLLKISSRTVENNIYQAEKAIRLFLKDNHVILRTVAGLVAIILS